MERKRAAGAGRKPQGEFTGKLATFSTRVTPETRRALEEAATKSGRSLSQEVEYHLRKAMEKPSGEGRNISLACAVALLVENIERGTKADWRSDPFTGQALHYGVEALLFHFAPPEEPRAVPPAVEAAAAKMPPEFAKRFRTPDWFGQLLAHNLILEIEQAASSSIPNEWSTPIFLSSDRPAQLALLKRDLMTAHSKKGKSK
jgi:hypothetical protein